MILFTCKVCGRTNISKKDMKFYWINENVWCARHVPNEVKWELRFCD